MKIPKRIKVKSIWYKIKYSKYGDGGSCNITKKIIEIPQNKKEQERVLLHEIMELLMYEDCLRYDAPNNSEFMFIMTHHKFSIYVEDLFAILKDNKIIN